MAASLTFSLIQPHMAWEDQSANLQHYEALIQGNSAPGQIVLLPEMFSTGFSMQPAPLAETMDGPTVQWMKDTAARHRIILCGSLIIAADGNFYNRLIWMQPDGAHYHYDKRHLFTYAGEHEQYTPGNKKLIVQVNGWRICPLICYDLRFPVFSRNDAAQPYDVLLYVANWPEKRRNAWQTLLRARAIENQCYVAGVNRVGRDGNGHDYAGDSALISPLGETIWQAGSGECVQAWTLDKALLTDYRAAFPALNDADSFRLL